MNENMLYFLQSLSQQSVKTPGKEFSSQVLHGKIQATSDAELYLFLLQYLDVTQSHISLFEIVEHIS